jgi:hypothetical protein
MLFSCLSILDFIYFYKDVEAHHFYYDFKLNNSESMEHDASIIIITIDRLFINMGYFTIK